MDFSRLVTKNMSRPERHVLYFELLHEVMERYDWTSACSSKVNWRRFLPKEDAIALNVVVPKIYAYTARFPRGDAEVVASLVIYQWFTTRRIID